MAHFTHLHLHTDYSLLDGAITLDRLVGFGKQHNFKALAITDHGNIFGAVKFFQQCAKAGIKPVLGMEAYLTEDVRIKNAENKYYHLIILVENNVGYKNLCKLISFAYGEGFYFKPRIDYKILAAHAEGLIVTSACLGGHIPSLLMGGNEARAHTQIDWFLNVFGEKRFYLEIQPPDQKEQAILNDHLFHIAQTRGIPLIAAGDCHYVSADDREAHEVMLAIQTHHKITDPDRFTFGDCRVHMRTADEMLSIFPQHHEAIWASGEIADRCDFSFQTGKIFFPEFEIPPQETEESYFRFLCSRGLAALFDRGRIDQTARETYEARLALEVDLIVKMGFIGYFLVVSDFIQWARAQGIPVGPGRGSAAGSLVSWALQITDIDPIRYNLLFERFLNPERITMPDIDIDFCIEGRDRVIQYVKDRYGHTKVCQIITFGTMMAKGVIKDIARVLGMPFDDANAISALIPDQLKITLKEAFEQEPKLRELQQSNPQAAKLFDLAFRLEGITRHASKHAAGIVIAPQAIDELLPIYVPPKTTDIVTQYAMTELETLGFLKMDFLGLKNLTLIDRAVKLIRQNYSIDLDSEKLPLDDATTFALLSRGETSGVFQLESEGLKEVLRRLQPAVFEDIIAVNALYRPGPLGSGMVDDFIERKHGRQEIRYIFPELESVLAETYGVIVYQEQVMKIASLIAGYSLGESDILRRAMGKKKPEEMEKQRTLFMTRAVARSFDEKKAGELFDLMAYFAGYGFNKSHSAAYALIAYQTAYLKANYPAEFMACLISLEATDAEKMAFYLHEAAQMRLEILKPDINESGIFFGARARSIRFGLQGIKNVGLAALENIMAVRTARPFESMLDFCMRVDLRTCNKRVIEHLIFAGAFDLLPGTRAQQFAELGALLDRAIEEKRAAQTGQMGLFGLGNNAHEAQTYQYTSTDIWSEAEILEKEKEVLGVYLSARPLDRYARLIQWIQATSLITAREKKEQPVLICGLVQSIKEITTKKGEKMAFVTLEDQTATGEAIIFPKAWRRLQTPPQSGTIVIIKGVVDGDSQTLCRIKTNDCILLDTLFDDTSRIHAVRFILDETFDHARIPSLKEHLPAGSCSYELRIREKGAILTLVPRAKIAVSFENLKALDAQSIGIELLL
jgi:DNA polymerase-3 subunit alpha